MKSRSVIPFLLLLILCTSCSVWAQQALRPVLDIRSAAHPTVNVEPEAFRFGLSVTVGEDAGRQFAGMGQTDARWITPVKDGDPLQGITVLDLIGMLRHIQNIEPFAEAWQWVAADIDRDNAITHHDVRALHQLLMNPFSELTDNQSWRFYNARHVFPVTFPLEEPIPESVACTFAAEQMQNRFWAVKVGDVDGSATQPRTEPAGDAAVSIALPDRLLQAGEEITLAVQVPGNTSFWGLQGALQLNDEAIQLVAAEQGSLLGMGADGLFLDPKGKTLRFSWMDAFPQVFTEKTVLLTIRLQARTTICLQEAVLPAPALLPGIAFDENGQAVPLRLALVELFPDESPELSKNPVLPIASEVVQPLRKAGEASNPAQW
jgi:hypothetical protein